METNGEMLTSKILHLTLKQDYVQDQIINAGYNIVEFHAFLDKLKPAGGMNLDNWTMDELVAVVQNYREEKRIENNPFMKFTDERKAMKANVEETKEQKKEDEPEFLYAPVMEKKKSKSGFYNEFPCKKLPLTTELSSEKNHITIPETFYVKGGLFQKSYHAYLIVTKPVKWEVLRRYSDMEWLRGYLIKAYPNFLIPPIPEKGDFYDSSVGKESQVEERRVFFEKFFNCLLLNPDIVKNPCFESFLKCQEEREWAVIKKEADRTESPRKIEHQLRASGNVQLDLTNETNISVAALDVFYKDLKLVYRDLKGLTNQLDTDVKQLSKTLFSMGDLYKTLAERTNELNKTAPSPHSVNLENIYKMGNNLFVSWGGETTSQINLLRSRLSNLYLYQDYEQNLIRESFKTSKKAMNEYIAYKTSLDTKKSKIYEKGTDKWEIPEEKLKLLDSTSATTYKEGVFKLLLAGETAHEDEMRDKSAFLQGTLQQQLDIVVENTASMFATDFSFLADQAQKNLMELSQKWANFKQTLLKMDGRQVEYNLIDKSIYAV